MRKLMHRVSCFLVHHPSLSWLDPFLRKLGIVDRLHVWAARNDKYDTARTVPFRQFCDQHQTELQEVSGMLEDDFSRKTLERMLTYRKTLDIQLLKGIVVQPQYFQKDIFGPVRDEVFVDGGAYVGDTALSFIREFSGGVYKKIYAWDPDTVNLEQLRKNTAKYGDVVCVPCGLWSEKTELSFLFTGDETSKIVEGDAAGQQKIQVDTIDNVCSSDKVTFIKMDIEGSELAALNGAVNVIKRDKPRLAICIYHKPEDLYEIPFWIKKTVPEYKLYIRQHSYGPAETVLYATL